MPASQFSMLVTQQFPLLTVSFISYTRCFEALMYQVLTAKQKEEYLTDMNKYQQQIKVQLKKVQKNTEK
jgi:hypothetical protein